MEEIVFKFDLADHVKLAMSDETGIIRGRAQYVMSENAYFVAYKAADGRLVENWFGESLLQPVQ